MRRLRHAVIRPCDAICAVLEPSAVLRVVRCGRCCSHIRFWSDELIADALSPLPRDCGASAHQLAAADAPCAASGADAFGCDTRALVLFPEAAAPASASPASRFALAVDGIDHGRRLEARTGRSERAYEAARQPGSDALKKDGLGPGFPWVRF